MQKLYNNMFLALVFLCLLSSIGCSSDSLEKEIKRFSKDDKLVSYQEFNKIIEFIKTNVSDLKDNYPALFLINGDINRDELARFIRQIRIRGDYITCELPNDNISLSIYLDNSISMDGYLKGNTELEACLVGILSKSAYYYNKNEMTKLKIINQKVFPYSLDDNNFKKSISNLEPKYPAYNVGGDLRGQSDLNQMISCIFDESKKNSVNILVTDGIYSIKNINKNILGCLEFQKNYTTDAYLKMFKNNLDFSTAVVYLESIYEGTYYDYLNNPHEYIGKRPYYLIITAKKEYLLPFLNNIKITEIQGYKNIALFLSGIKEKWPMKIVQTTDKKGNFHNDRELNENGISLNDVKADKDGVLQFGIAISLDTLAFSNSYLFDIKNYQVSSGFKIFGVQKYQPSNFEANENVTLKSINPTHVILLRNDKYQGEDEIILSFLDNIAPWIKENDTMNDCKDITQNKTFGISYLADGILEAYKTQIKKNEGMEFKYQIKINLKP